MFENTLLRFCLSVVAVVVLFKFFFVVVAFVVNYRFWSLVFGILSLGLGLRVWEIANMST